MTIRVNIGEAKKRLSELVAAALRGEEVVLARAGDPQVRLIPVAERSEEQRAALRARRESAFGMFREALKGGDTSPEALKADRPDPEERFRRNSDLLIDTHVLGWVIGGEELKTAARDARYPVRTLW